MKLDKNEKFLSFLTFKQYSDIGFYPRDIRVECSSHFAFLTTGRDSSNLKFNRINLVIIDPFYEDLQIALFKSNTVFDSEILEQSDVVVGCVAQSTKGKRSDNSFGNYIWTQFPEGLIRSKMLKHGQNVFDSDIEETESEDSD